MIALYNNRCKIPVKKREKKLRLLVVEDEKKLCDMIAKSLHQAGYEVDTCNDGEEALEMICAEMYDLIVLDLNLPGMDGMDILRELRRENEETKVLILSARSQIADKVEGLDAGANDYGKTISSAGTGSSCQKSDKKKICTEKCLPGMRCSSFQHKRTNSVCKRDPCCTDKKREWDPGISSSEPGAAGQSGRIDRTCLGFFCGQFQWFDPGPYVFSPEKAEGRTWLRSGRK